MGGRGSGSGVSSGGFREFSDRASDGWTYSGTGQDQIDFFMNNSNFSELMDSMSYDERDDFRAWCRGVFMDGQQYAGWDSMSDRDKWRTQTYDKYLDKATLSEGVVLSRRSDAQLVLGAGNSHASLEALQAAEGSIVTCKGNMSFGAAKQGLTIGASNKNVEYHMKVAGGTKGSGMWVGDQRVNGWGAQQREFVTNRDIAIKVGKTIYNSSRGVYEVELEYVGRLAHDYGTSGKMKGPRG